MALVGFYIIVVWLGSRSWAHAVQLLLADRYYVVAVALGFGIQIGLYAHVRGLLRDSAGLRSSTAIAAAGTGTSTTSMVACCLHHVADVLPVVGLTGAAVFLSDYKVPLIMVGLATNGIGIGLMGRVIRHHRRTGAATGFHTTKPATEKAAHCQTPG
ncbi:MAG: hypothetical protein QN152_09020 [Armatimonadota bacterium]|nr:hypothetical protein [Armatimonadota bacterium]MDR7426505.1 hypothetical protein [Armatimonadota bacterium]MDR7464766.1 hypothetical protein [Armatimonadota bacterium]MDR7468543.1 hypothetical protein [Armatimonadota bacterium]MDR7475136.1 hypothetical protein [Armatimonadota bacterium]